MEVIKMKYFFIEDLQVKLLNPIPTGKLGDHISFFEKRIYDFNGRKSSSNQKFISLLKVDDDAITIRVESELELAVPGRAFTGFSRSLLKNTDEDYDPFFEQNIFHNKLLTFERISDEEDSNEAITKQELLYRLDSLVLKTRKMLSRSKCFYR